MCSSFTVNCRSAGQDRLLNVQSMDDSPGLNTGSAYGCADRIVLKNLEFSYLVYVCVRERVCLFACLSVHAAQFHK